jgi:hypothetical protein
MGDLVEDDTREPECIIKEPEWCDPGIQPVEPYRDQYDKQCKDDNIEKSCNIHPDSFLILSVCGGKNMGVHGIKKKVKVSRQLKHS